MPTQAELLERLGSEAGAISNKDLAEKLGVKRDQISSNLSRLVKKELIEKTETGFVITGKGREALTKKGEGDDDGDGGGDEDGDEDDPKTPEQLGVTPYQVFKRIGAQIGIEHKGKLRVAVDHIWRGGNWRDMEWVRAGLVQMGIREDLVEPWVNAWTSYLSSATQRPSSTAAAIEKSGDGDGAQGGGGGVAAAGAVVVSRAGFDYNLGAEDEPIYVGPGLGDMKYKDALDLAKVKAARSAGKGSGGGDDATMKLLVTLREMGFSMGGGGGGPVPKTLVVSTDEEGNARVEEIQNTDGGPTVVTAPKSSAGPKRKHTYIHADGKIEQIEEGQPVIIHVGQPAANVGGGDGKVRLIDKATGKIEEYPAGVPIIIQQAPPVAVPATTGAQTIIQMKDKDGNPVTFDMDSYFRMETFKADERRKEESHQTRQDLTKGVKDLLKKGASALDHMGTAKE
ncbi:MAG: MarR family transcriptional regulator [Dehalococcoidia bacterium]|nr:MarR family transcriptional regulator [Dehalococcoidia bacterium]